MTNNQNSEEDAKAQRTYQRLADISLRTSATALAIIFAYTFAVSDTASMGFRYFIVGVAITLLFSIICGVGCLFGQEEGELRFIKTFSFFSTILMLLGMIFAFLLLVIVLFSP
jgi:hypothetical protein